MFVLLSKEIGLGELTNYKFTIFGSIFRYIIVTPIDWVNQKFKIYLELVKNYLEA